MRMPSAPDPARHPARKPKLEAGGMTGQGIEDFYEKRPISFNLSDDTRRVYAGIHARSF